MLTRDRELLKRRGIDHLRRQRVGRQKQEDIAREKMKVDISALLGGDIYAALRDRSVAAKQRFAKERDEKRAIEERKRCLAKLQQALDIPPEVMNALPSMEQIQAKASAARAVAE